MCWICRSENSLQAVAAGTGQADSPSETWAEEWPPSSASGAPGAAYVGGCGDARIDGLLSSRLWTGGSVSYSFPATSLEYGADYGSGEHLQGFAQAVFAQSQAVRFLLEGASPHGGGPVMRYGSVEAFTNLSFTETSASGADLRVAQSNVPSTAWAYGPSSHPVGGDVWLGTAYAGTVNDLRTPVPGGYAWHTIMHELGHSLGLKHGHETGNLGAVPTDWDSLEFTVMTYRSYVGDPLGGGYRYEHGGAPQTWMMLDIAALQHMYGADYTTNAGATVYSWSAATGEMQVNGIGQGAPVRNRVFLTVWDGGGTDTYEFSNYGTNLRIDLQPGGWSHLGGTAQLAWLGGGPNGGYARGHVFNALQVGGDARSLIENAIGGSGHDTLIGNAAVNHMQGGSGSDVLMGGAGNDLLVGGRLDLAGAEDGTDSAAWAGPRSRYDVRSFEQGGRFVTTVRDLTGAEGTDTVIGIETLTFAGGPGFGVAGAQQNRTANFDANAGDDVLMQFGTTGGVYWQDMHGGQAQGLRTALGALPNGWRACGSADINGDGRAEILVQDLSNGSTYYVDMAGAAPTWHAVTTSVHAGFRVVGVGDLTRDGTPDVVFQAADGFIYAADMEAGGAFGRWLQVGNLLNQWRVAGVGDFNRDGAADVMVQEVATGTGTTYYRDVLGSGWGFVAGGLGTTWEARGTGDLTGDGFHDGVFRNRLTGDIVYVDMRSGSGSGASWGVIADRLTGWEVRGLADLDNDGYEDVVVQSLADGSVSWRDMEAGVATKWGVVASPIGTAWSVV